jgi:hypothetical protein
MNKENLERRLTIYELLRHLSASGMEDGCAFLYVLGVGHRIMNYE